MRSKLTFIFMLLLLAGCSSDIQKEKSISVDEVYPGVIHKQIINVDDTLFINVLKIDLENDDYFLQAVKADDSLLGRETVSAMVERLEDSGNDIISAINSDFFIITEGGEPENNLVINSQFAKGTPETDSGYDTFDNTHSQFAITENGKPEIGRFDFDGKLILNNESEFRVNRINSRTDSATITIYNFYQGSKTPEADSTENLELRLKPIYSKEDTNFYTVSKFLDSKGENEIEIDEIILSTNYDMADSLNKYLNIGDTIKTILKFSPDIGRIFTATGGWGKIVEGGKNIASKVDSKEGTFTKFSEVKHPRTGIGISEDSNYIYFVTVDGRQESSSGATLEEFARIMIDEDIYEGLNFDGGGSTTMVVDGEIVNHPSDKNGEREVGVGLVLVKKNE